MPNVLITSVGSLVGHNILNSLKPARERLYVIGTETDPCAANNFRCDAAFLVPPSSEEEPFANRLREIIRNEHVDLVLSGTDTDLPNLASLGARESLGQAIVLVPPTELVHICNDKYQTYLFAREHGLPFAETAAVPDELERLMKVAEYPLICKARGGSATQGVFLAEGPRQAKAALVDGRYILQPYIGDDREIAELRTPSPFGVRLSVSFRSLQYSTQFLIGRKGSIIGYLATDALMIGGRSIRCRRIHDDHLDAVARQYGRCMADLGYQGPLNIQSKRLPDGSYVPFELNARFTGQTDARLLLGYNELRLALEHFLDFQWPSEPLSGVDHPHAVTRILTSYVTDRRDVETLASEKRWSQG